MSIGSLVIASAIISWYFPSFVSPLYSSIAIAFSKSFDSSLMALSANSSKRRTTVEAEVP